MVMDASYEALTPPALRERMREAPVAYLPLGTLEYHGPHLPLGSDMLQPIGVYKELARSIGGVVLPPMSMGPDEVSIVNGTVFYGMDFENLVEDEKPRILPGSAYFIEDSMFIDYSRSMIKQLARAGFKVVVGHGHGPSTDLFTRHGPKWGREHGVRVLTFQGILPEKELGFMIDHAGANETSIMLATNPGLVRMENLPKDRNTWPKGVMGADPRVHASAEMGHRIVNANLRAMETLLREHLAAL